MTRKRERKGLRPASVCRTVNEMTATARSRATLPLFTGALLLLALMAQSFAWPASRAGAQELSPLPASDYAARPVCRPPAPGRASCAAVELVGLTQAARAREHPIGMTESAPARAGDGAAGECEPPIAAEGCWGLRPQDLHSAYALPTTTASAQTQTIALVDAYDDPTAEKDLKVYDEEFDLPACTKANGCFTKVNQEGKHKPLPEPNGEAAVEISLDVEIAHAVCQNCRILLVEASSLKYSDLETAEDRAVAMGATEISNSWYGSEPASDSAAFDHPGVVITAAAGDYGYLNWGFSGEPAPEEIERGSVNYPASSPHVIAVGGTHLELSAPENTWESELVWNGYGATGSGCSSSFAAPPWQLQDADWPSVGCGSHRALTDVAADADPYTGVAVYDSTPVNGTAHYWRTIGGTSLSSPLIAATFALAGGAGGVEYPAKTLYENERASAASLHDVESGSDGECTKRVTAEGLSGCTVAEEGASCSGAAICVAGPGYDGPSGVGTPDGLGAFEPTGEPGKAVQTIEFTSDAPEKATVAGDAYAVAATASSGLAPFFTSGSPFVCEVAGSTVSFIGAGTCTIDANQAGDGAYKAAPQAHQSFAVGRGSQAISFTSTAPSPATVGGPVYAVTATASSGLAVSFSSQTPAVCTLEGATASFLAQGTCTIEANQAGSSNYKSAPPAQQSFKVSEKAQTIEFTSTAPSSATVGGSVYAVTTTASSGLPVTLAAQPGSVCILTETPTESAVSFSGAGTCTITARQAGNDEYEAAPEAQQSFTVSATPPSASPSVEGTEPSSSTLSFTSSLTPVLTPDSAFTLLGKPRVNRRTGAIAFTVSVLGPGRLSWLLTFPNGRFGAFRASAEKCGAGRILLKGRCRPAKIVFATASIAVAAAGTVSFTVKPGASAGRALKNALAKRHGLPVTATLSFQSSLGGRPVSHTRSLADRLEASDKHKS